MWHFDLIALSLHRKQILSRHFLTFHIMELQETSLKRAFEDQGWFIEDFQSSIISAATAMLGEAKNVSTETMSAVKRALEDFSRLVDTCSSIIINESAEPETTNAISDECH